MKRQGAKDSLGLSNLEARARGGSMFTNDQWEEVFAAFDRGVPLQSIYNDLYLRKIVTSCQTKFRDQFRSAHLRLRKTLPLLNRGRSA